MMSKWSETFRSICAFSPAETLAELLAARTWICPACKTRLRRTASTQMSECQDNATVPEMRPENLLYFVPRTTDSLIPLSLPGGWVTRLPEWLCLLPAHGNFVYLRSGQILTSPPSKNISTSDNNCKTRNFLVILNRVSKTCLPKTKRCTF